MRIGIIGSGNMGRAVGVRLTRLGHELVFGSRDAEPGRLAAELAGGTSRAASNDEAAQFGELLIWTIRETDPRGVVSDHAVLDGKIVVDLNNRDYAAEVKQGAWFGEAIAERFQANAPGVRVVKALNTVAMETLDTSPDQLRAAGAQVFLAGDDMAAKQTVARVLGELGFEAIDLGQGAVAMRAAEALGDVTRLLMIDGGKGGRANLQPRMLPAPDLGSIGDRASSNYR